MEEGPNERRLWVAQSYGSMGFRKPRFNGVSLIQGTQVRDTVSGLRSGGMWLGVGKGLGAMKSKNSLHPEQSRVQGQDQRLLLFTDRQKLMHQKLGSTPDLCWWGWAWFSGRETGSTEKAPRGWSHPPGSLEEGRDRRG